MLVSPFWEALQQLRTLRHTCLSPMGQTYGCLHITGRPVISIFKMQYLTLELLDCSLDTPYVYKISHLGNVNYILAC